MKCRPTSLPSRSAEHARGQGAFTLAETLASLAFVAVVIPIAVHGVRVANLAAQVADRRIVATRVADHVLGELVATGRWNMASSGTVQEGRHTFTWQSQSIAWERATLREVSVTVSYTVQGNPHVARAATILDSAQQ
jgi:type II secretory pathway pseudopilin PulG